MHQSKNKKIVSEIMRANGRRTWKKHRRSKAYMRALNKKSIAARLRNKTKKLSPSSI